MTTLFNFVSITFTGYRDSVPLNIIEATVFACCDFIAQFILVRTTGNAYRYHLIP